MILRIGSKAPDFEAESTEGPISFHQWLGSSWCVFFSHPKNFTPVCATELGALAGMKGEFEARHCKLVGLSVDSLADHKRWIPDIVAITGAAPNYPLIGDTDLRIAKLYGMLPEDANGSAASRTAMDNQTVRNVFVIAPDKTIRAIVAYPMSSGRNFHEILRLLDSIQLTANHQVATPVNWKRGDEVIILASLPDVEARKAFPRGWHAPRPYVRYVPDPAGGSH